MLLPLFLFYSQSPWYRLLNSSPTLPLCLHPKTSIGMIYVLMYVSMYIQYTCVFAYIFEYEYALTRGEPYIFIPQWPSVAHLSACLVLAGMADLSLTSIRLPVGTAVRPSILIYVRFISLFNTRLICDLWYELAKLALQCPSNWNAGFGLFGHSSMEYFVHSRRSCQKFKMPIRECIRGSI